MSSSNLLFPAMLTEAVGGWGRTEGGGVDDEFGQSMTDVVSIIAAEDE